MSSETDTITGFDTQIAQAPPNPKGRSAAAEDKMRFFDELHRPMRDLARVTGIHDDLLLTLAAHESGWWGAVAQPGTQNLSRDKHNPFGFVKSGKKVTYPSLETALNVFRNDRWGQHLKGVKDIEDFVRKLQDEPPPDWKRYNSDTPIPTPTRTSFGACTRA